MLVAELIATLESLHFF